jgi:hypothetical protein
MPDFQWLTDLADRAKMVMPWITGGVGGAILTFTLNQRLARRNRSRLDVIQKSIEYKLPAQDGAFRQLEVAYGGRTYPRLAYHEICITNSSSKQSPAVSFVLVFTKEAEILDKIIATSPLPIDVAEDAAGLKPWMRRYAVSPMQPGDSVKLGLIVVNGPAVECLYRGPDSVDIVTSGSPVSSASDADLRSAIYYLALFTMAGAVPLISDLFRALILIGASPLLFRFATRWREVSRRGNQPLVSNIEVHGEGEVLFAHDSQSDRSALEIRARRQSPPHVGE